MFTSFPLLWWPAAVGCAIAFWALHRRATDARRRVEGGHCLGCGYDLRGSADRCPECGRATLRRLDRAKLRRPPSPTERMRSGPAVEPLDAVAHETADGEEARLVVMQLTLRGVPAVRTDSAFPGQPFLVLFRVNVGGADLRRATAIVRQFEPDEPTVEPVGPTR